MTGREEKVGRYRGDAHRVRPTASWAALGVLVLGVAVVGVGVLLMSWPLAAAGAERLQLLPFVELGVLWLDAPPATLL